MSNSPQRQNQRTNKQTNKPRQTYNLIRGSNNKHDQKN